MATLIRPALVSDLPRIREIAETSWRGQGGDWLAEQVYGPIGGTPWMEWFWPNILNKFRQTPEWLYVSVIDGRVVGFASLSLNRDLRIGTIGYNAVDPACRGQGLGRRQIDSIMDVFRREGMRYVNVVVALNDGHRAARAVYGSIGCRTVGVMELRWGRLAREDGGGGGRTEGVTIRSASAADVAFAAAAVRACLAEGHPYANMEARHGVIDRPWAERVLAEIVPAMAGPPPHALIAEFRGQPAGLLIANADPGRERGTVRWVLVPPGSAGAAVESALIAAATRRFCDAELKYLQTMVFLGADGTGLSAETVSRFRLTDIVTQSEFKFMALADGRSGG